MCLFTLNVWHVISVRAPVWHAAVKEAASVTGGRSWSGRRKSA
jgi:hypothetical protein